MAKPVSLEEQHLELGLTPKPPPAAVVTLMIPVEQLEEDPDNARKEFDVAALDALGDNMLLQGQLQPIGVRPKKAAGQVVPNRWVVKWGHRRLRAAIRKKIPKLRCEVLDASDDQVPAQQLAENDQREALKSLERSNKHQQMRARGQTLEQIAKDTSTSPATVRDSLKLQELAPAVKKAWVDGKLDYSDALEFAKLPTKVQPDALTGALELMEEAEEDDRKVGVRGLRVYLRDEFMLDLANAPFPVADAQLVPSAGACTTCPFRTGAQPDMFAHLKSEPDVCTNKPCYDAKGDALLARAEKEGRRVLSPKEAKEAFNLYGGDVDRSSGFVAADEKPWMNSGGRSKKTHKQMVEPDQLVLAKNPHTGVVCELVPKAALPKEKSEDGGRGAPRKKSATDLKNERKHAITNRHIKLILDQMMQRKAVENRNDAFLRMIAIGILHGAQEEPKRRLCRALGLEPEKGYGEAARAVVAHLETLSGAPLSRVMVMVACCEMNSQSFYSEGLGDDLLAAAKLLDVRPEQLRTFATEQIDAELKEKADKKAGKKSSRDTDFVRWNPPDKKGVVVGVGVGTKTRYLVKPSKGQWVAGRANTTGALVQGFGPFPSIASAQIFMDNVEDQEIEDRKAKKNGRAA